MGSPTSERVAAVRAVVADHLGGGRVDSVVPVGEGTDHLAFEVGGELIVRWSKQPDAAARAATVEAAMGSYRAESNDLGLLAERAVFYARCKLLEDLAYGLQTGRDAYVDKSLAGITWVFPA